MKNTLHKQFCKLTNSDTSLPKNTFAFKVLLALFFKSNVTTKSKLTTRCVFALFALFLLNTQVSFGQKYWNTSGTSSTWTASNWGTSGAGPFTGAWVNSNNAFFTATSAITNVTNTPIGNITVSGSSSVVTVTSAGTYLNSPVVATIDVASGCSINYQGQGFSTTAGFIKNGAGTMMSSNGNSYTAGFTLNAGTFIAGGVNSMGAGGALTINGGVLAASSTKTFTASKFSSITVGGNFTLGAASNTANMSFADPVSLGTAVRSINMNGVAGTSLYTFSGILSGTGGGINVGPTTGNGTLTLSGVNTYTGDTTISGGVLSLGTTGKIATSANIIIGSGGTFNVSLLTTPIALGSTQTLKVSATGSNTTGTLTVTTSKGLTLSASGLSFTGFDGGATAPLTVSGAAGELALNSAPITVTTTGSALGVGTYTLVAKAGVAAVVSGSPGTLTINGLGLAASTSASVAVTSGQLILTVVSTNTPILAITANTTAAFGSVCTNASPVTKTYTITNTGTAASNVVVTSSNAEYVVGALSSTDVSATNGTVTFDVTYTPSSGSTGTTLTSKYDTSTTSGTLGLTGTAVAPITQVVSTSAATLVVNTTATLNGNYTTAGVCPATNEKGFVYAVKSTNADPLVSVIGVLQSIVSVGSTGTYLKALTGLTPATTYTYKAYVYNGTDYTYGAVEDFTTLAVATKLVFSVAPPTTGTVGLNLTSFTVQAQRADNSVDAEYVASIVIGRTAVSGSGALTGTTVAATAGVAVFAATQLDGAGTYTITASSGSLTGATAASNTVISLVATAMASWNFSTSTMTGAAPTATANANVTVGALTRGSAVITTGNVYTRQWGGFGWSTSTSVATAATAGWHLSFTITPKANYEVSFNNIPAYQLYSNNTGPGNEQWQYSLNGTTFTSIADITTPTNGLNSLGLIDLSTITELQNVPATTTVTFRLVAYGAGSSTSGTFSFYDTTNSTAADFIVNGYATATSTTWTTSWSNGTPTTSLDAIINGDFSTTATGDTAGFSAKTLTVNASKVFTINTGHNITVAGAVTNNGTVTVDNNANLIQTAAGIDTNSGSGTAIVKRNSASIYLYDYTLWSSPVSNVGQFLTTFSPNTLTTRFYTYDSTLGLNGLYSAVSSPATTNFAPAKGYLIRMPNTDPLAGYNAGTAPLTYPGIFTGVPNNGDISVMGLFSGKYYAVGNPYPSTINVAAFYAENSNAGTLYFWRRRNGDSSTTAYATTNSVGQTAASGGLEPSTDIAVGQGFFVSPIINMDLKFTNAMRITPSTSAVFLRTTTEERNRFWLNLTNTSGAFSQMLVGYLPEATSGVDNAIDGKYINDAPVALTSIINAEEYTIQGRALPFATTDTVALGFKTNAAGNYTIAIDHVDGLFSTGQAVFLKDNLLNTVVDLSAGSYSFASAIGTFNSRFEVVYQSTLAVTNPTFTANSVIAFSANGEIRINSGSTIMELVRVYDLQGRLLVEKNQVNATETKLSTTATNQVLLVEITAANGSKITKKIIQ